MASNQEPTCECRWSDQRADYLVWVDCAVAGRMMTARKQPGKGDALAQHIARAVDRLRAEERAKLMPTYEQLREAWADAGDPRVWGLYVYDALLPFCADVEQIKREARDELMRDAVAWREQAANGVPEIMVVFREWVRKTPVAERTTIGAFEAAWETLLPYCQPVERAKGVPTLQLIADEHILDDDFSFGESVYNRLLPFCQPVEQIKQAAREEAWGDGHPDFLRRYREDVRAELLAEQAATEPPSAPSDEEIEAAARELCPGDGWAAGFEHVGFGKGVTWRERYAFEPVTPPSDEEIEAAFREFYQPPWGNPPAFVTWSRAVAWREGYAFPEPPGPPSDEEIEAAYEAYVPPETSPDRTKHSPTWKAAVAWLLQRGVPKTEPPARWQDTTPYKPLIGEPTSDDDIVYEETQQPVRDELYIGVIGESPQPDGVKENPIRLLHKIDGSTDAHEIREFAREIKRVTSQMVDPLNIGLIKAGASRAKDAYVDPWPVAVGEPTPALGTCLEEFSKAFLPVGTNLWGAWVACWSLFHPKPPEPDLCEAAFRERYPNEKDEPEEAYAATLGLFRDGWAARGEQP